MHKPSALCILLAMAATLCAAPSFAATQLLPGQWQENVLMDGGMHDQLQFCLHRSDPFAQFLHARPGSVCRRTALEHAGPNSIRLQEICTGTTDPYHLQAEITLHIGSDGRSYQGTLHGTMQVAGETVPIQETLTGTYQGACR